VKIKIRYSVLIIILLLIGSSSCKKKKVDNPAVENRGTYFSINQFMVDQWQTFHGEPFMIVKSIIKDGQTDSTLENSDTLNWAAIIKLFSETDISDPKFLDHYKVTPIQDAADGTNNLFYEANEDDEELFTRKLLLTFDAYNSKVKGIYIVTEKKTVFDDCVQKLYYSPMKTLQIQTEDKPLIGSKTHTVVEYNFKR
jgi:hypothetical protein